MSKKSITIILCIALIAAFFLPYLSNGSLSYSGLKVMFGDKEVEGISKGGKALFLSLLIPIGALLVLLQVFFDNSSMGIIRWMPLIGVVYLLVMLYIQANGEASIGEFIGYFSYGLWITIVAAIILPFVSD